MSDSRRVSQPAKIIVRPFGSLPDGTLNSLYTLTNTNGIAMSVMNYGGIIQALVVPDRSGAFEDIVLGYDTLNGYLKDNSYFGALIGRYANRIAKGKFIIDDVEHSLSQNNMGNTLHGGAKGFDRRMWEINKHEVESGAAIKLTYKSKDGEEGFPGDLFTTVVYHLTDDNELRIEYHAETDKPTVVNLTQHTYFNLSGNTKRTILDQKLKIFASHFIPVDQSLIPTGEIRPVEGTPFDFSALKPIGAELEKADQQLAFGDGYDHCWALSGPPKKLKLAALLVDELTGRTLTVETTEPGIQFYSGNFLDGTITGKYNVVYQKRSGICLETEHYPDSPNQKSFPSVLLRPSEKYHTITVYKFGVT